MLNLYGFKVSLFKWLLIIVDTSYPLAARKALNHIDNPDQYYMIRLWYCSVTACALGRLSSKPSGQIKCIVYFRFSRQWRV